MTDSEHIVRVPEIQAGTDPIEVGVWLVEEGQDVTEGDRLVELILPGIVIHVSADESGLIGQIVSFAGQRVSEGDPLARLMMWRDEEP